MNGQVVAAFDDEEEAYGAGVKRFGRHGAWVLRQVVEPQTFYGTNGISKP